MRIGNVCPLASPGKVTLSPLLKNIDNPLPMLYTIPIKNHEYYSELILEFIKFKSDRIFAIRFATCS